MALRQSFQTVEFAASGDRVTPDAGQAWRVRDLVAYNPTAGEYIDVVLEERTTGRFRVLGKGGNTIPYPSAYDADFYMGAERRFLPYMRARGFDLSIPVPAEHRLLIEWPDATVDHVIAQVEVYDEADVRADEPNGPNSSIRRFISHGHNADAFAGTADAPISLDGADMPAGMPEWPWNGDGVPAGQRFKVYGIVGCPASFSKATSTATGYTDRVQAYVRGTPLFGEDREGLPFVAGGSNTSESTTYDISYSLIGPHSDTLAMPMLWFGEPLVFEEGEELNLQVECVAESSVLECPAGELGLALVLEQEYVRR